MMIKMVKKYASLVCMVAGLSSFGASAAEFEYPAKNVRLFVPAAPGAATDGLARAYAREFERLTGTPVAVVNQSGGGGVVAFQSVVQGRPDGSVLMFYHSALHVASNSGRSPFGYKDMKPLATFGALNEVYAVSKNAPYSNIKELIEYAKASSDGLSVGIQLGGGSQLKGMALSNLAEGKIRVVDAGSEGQRLPLLLGGQLDIGIMGVSTALQYEKNGDIKILGVINSEPDPQAPHWPTTTDQGVDVVLPLMFTLYGQKNMNDELVTMLDNINTTIATSEHFQDGMSSFGVVSSYRDAFEALEFVSQEDQRVSALLK